GDAQDYAYTTASSNTAAASSSYTHTYPDCDNHADCYTNGDIHCYAYGHPDSDSNRNSHGYCDNHADGYSHSNTYPDAHSDHDGYTNSYRDAYTYTSIRGGRLQSPGWTAGSQLDEAAGVGKQPDHRQQPGRGGCREPPQLCLLVG